MSERGSPAGESSVAWVVSGRRREAAGESSGPERSPRRRPYSPSRWPITPGLAAITTGFFVMMSCAPASPGASGQSALSAAPANAAAPAASQAHAQPQEATKLTLAQAVPAMAFAPVMLAKDTGLFAEEGIDLDHQMAGSAANALAALTSGDAQLMAGGGDTVLNAYEKRLDMLAIAGVTTANLFGWAVGNRWLQQTGVGPESPLADRVAALKGARVGAATVGGLGPRLGNYMLLQSGYDPEATVDWAAAGTGAALAAALRQGQVDAIFNGVPDPEFVEDEGIGRVYIVMAQDFPFTQSFVHNALAAKRQWAEANPDLAQRAARAIGRAANRLRSDPESAKTVLQAEFPALKPSVLDLALAHARPAFSQDARMTEEMWRNTIEVYRATGTVSSEIPPAEGTYWTNKYLVDVPPQ